MKMRNEVNMSAYSFDDFSAEELNAAISLSGKSKKSIASQLKCDPSYITLMINGRGLPSAEKKEKFMNLLRDELDRVWRSR
jgi:hypothetical protein